MFFFFAHQKCNKMHFYVLKSWLCWAETGQPVRQTSVFVRMEIFEDPAIKDEDHHPPIKQLSTHTENEILHTFIYAYTHS